MSSNPSQSQYDKIIEQGLSINKTAKALAYMVFREIIEDAHAKYKISDKEMKALNKQAVNRAALFLECMSDKEIMASLVLLYQLETTGWDEPEKTEDTKKLWDFFKEAADELHTIKP